MTDRKQRLAALADTVRALDGADREIDVLIWYYAGPALEDHPKCREMTPAQAAGYVYGRLAYVNQADLTLEHVSYRGPAYTGSTDVAMELVPDDMSFEVRRSGTGDRGQATVWDPMRAVGEREWRVTGCATPALALLSVALRAQSETVA